MYFIKFQLVQQTIEGEFRNIFFKRTIQTFTITGT